MRNLLTQLLAVGPELAAFIFSSALLQARPALAITQNAVPSPNLDLSQLGRVALAGDFDSISLYEYEGQSEGGNSNGSQSLLARYPNGAFQTLGTTDAYIETMCPFISNGELQGVLVGGNFTSFGGTQAQGIALFDPDTAEITPLTGLSGRVSALYCDDESGTVYVGGSFTAGNSTNAMAWVEGWTNLPFAGFNGPVTSIIKNSAGNIVFGGSFSGLGNTTTPNEPDAQAIPLLSGNVSAVGTTSRDGFNDPQSIVCSTGSQDGSQTAWLLDEGRSGYWQGYYAFGFNPTKLRLYNTQEEGYGTKTFYFENLNSGGIMNLEYSDADGNNQSCSSRCPLASNATAQDFHFAPPVGMSSFRINIVDYYGNGGGLAGIELFQDDMYSFAVTDFNEPKCDGLSNGSTSTQSPSNGTWFQKPNNDKTSSDYLSAYLTNSSQVDEDTSVTFIPDLRQSGNYSITVYTPGCIQDDTCDTRGQVNLTASMTSSDPPVSSTFFQTNYYDKFDQIYFGYVDVDGGNFRPSVTLSPSAGQEVPLTVVAQRVRFELLNSTSGLKGIFEYKPDQATVSTDLTDSAINTAGHDLTSGAVVNSVVSYQDLVFVAGNFSGDGIDNVMSVGDSANSLPGGGLNREVQTIFQDGNMLYMGGNFSNTADNSVEGLNNIAVFDADSNAWSAFGAGVDGPVFDIVPLDLNITAGDLQTCLAISGAFQSVNEFGDNAAFDAAGFAIWVPARENWLNNLADVSIAIRGSLVAYTNVPDHETLFSGSISSQAQGFSDAVELVGSGQSLMGLGIKLQPASESSSMKKRALDTSTSSNATGVYNGLYYNENSLNITVLGGSFSATATNGSTVENLLFINNTDSEQTISGVFGLDSSSIFVAMDTINTLLFAGGAVTGSIDGNPAGGLAVVDLSTGLFASPQPPGLAGDNVLVNAVATQPSSSKVFVGGNFQSAGSLPCQTLCFYDIEAQQWDTPGSDLSGTINSMVWKSKNQLIIAGNLTLGDNSTTMATYNAKDQNFESYADTPSIFGTILALSAADAQYNSWWASGRTADDGSTFLAKYSDDGWTLVPGLGDGTTIRGLQPMSVTSSHSNSDLVGQNQVLMLTGNLAIPSFGNASAALYNGTDFTPYILTSTASGGQGTLSGIFVSNPQNLMSGGGHHLALGLVVLVGLAIALGLIFLLVIIGILLERQRRRKEGYVPMTRQRGGAGNLSRIPPESLLGRLQEKDSPPKL